MKVRFEEKFEMFQKNGLGSIRTLLADDGSVWFVGKDVGECLGLGTGLKEAYRKLEASEKATISAASLKAISNDLQKTEKKTGRGGSRRFLVISESGLYDMILSSRKKEAREFQRWITKEVLPSIRKNGGYIWGQEDLEKKDMILMEGLVQALTERVKKLRTRRHELIVENKELKAERKRSKKNLKEYDWICNTYEGMIDAYYSDFQKVISENKALKRRIDLLKNPTPQAAARDADTAPEYYYDNLGNRYATSEEAVEAIKAARE